MLDNYYHDQHSSVHEDDPEPVHPLHQQPPQDDQEPGHPLYLQLAQGQADTIDHNNGDTPEHIYLPQPNPVQVIPPPTQEYDPGPDLLPQHPPDQADKGPDDQLPVTGPITRSKTRKTNI